MPPKPPRKPREVGEKALLNTKRKRERDRKRERCDGHDLLSLSLPKKCQKSSKQFLDNFFVKKKKKKTFLSSTVYKFWFKLF